MSAPLAEARGYGVTSTDKPTDFSVQSYKLKTPGPRDVTLSIEYCGVCGSDVHTVTGGWGPLSSDFVVPGHEVVGTVTFVGEDAKDEFKVGQRVGVGAQVFSCLDCKRCKTDNEQYCPKQVDTYNAPYPDGVLAQGGYSSAIRVDKQFVFPIPDALESEKVGPLFCAGATVYSPLVRNDVGPGKRVGIVGIGGLGHLAVQFAKALGANVTVFSHSISKATDAIRLGADKFISTADKDFASKFEGDDELDFILITADANAIPIGDLMSTLKLHHKAVAVGIPDANTPWEIPGMALLGNGSCLGGSHIGSKKEILAMLDLAAEKGVRPWVDQILPMSEAGKAIQGVKDNKVRYRYVLKQDLV
ncbi:hypothetical protein QFC24_006787 [Naganishia onofrii]|uniref:Uncharacterized protein n=1 Tax=Naganishia onofrii TaxID=1851511 RepID=A0ACC2WY68_9TREE|nr:hypothetical protein QFC24_006787 [Naganishia onofrii]